MSIPELVCCVDAFWQQQEALVAPGLPAPPGCLGYPELTLSRHYHRQLGVLAKVFTVAENW
jgi:hypothetical protein